MIVGREEFLVNMGIFTQAQSYDNIGGYAVRLVALWLFST